MATQTGPKDYSPTVSSSTDYGYRPGGGLAGYYDNLMITYASTIGVSHIGPYLTQPNTFFSNSIGPAQFYVSGATNSAEINRFARILKALPPSARGTRANLVDNGGFGLYWDFNVDRLPGSLSPVASNGLVSTGGNWVRATGTGYGNPWPEIGLSEMTEVWNRYIDALGNCGASFDFVLMDVEGAYPQNNFALPPGVGNAGQADLWNAMVSHTYWTSPYRGLSGYGQLWAFWGGSTSQSWSYAVSQDQGTPAVNSWANYNSSAKLTGHVWKTGFADSLRARYPKSMFGNYAYAEGYSQNVFDYPSGEDGVLGGYGGLGGNVPSPVLYGTVRQGSVNSTNPRTVIYGDSTRSGHYRTETAENPSTRNNFSLIMPWTSHSAAQTLLSVMQDLRFCKQGSPNIGMVPWIPGWFNIGYQEGGHFYTITFSDTSMLLSELQSEKYYKNYVTITSGQTSYDGTTSAFRIATTVQPIVSGLWYKQNIKSINFDGNTSSFEIVTSPTVGTTSALAYYISGLTVGDTYTFAYEIDLNRSFTGGSSRFFEWSTSESTTTAPSLTSTSGITYEQILPVSGGIQYLSSGISYGVGVSGWTRFAWNFRPTSSANIALHGFFGVTDVTGGNTVYIRNIGVNRTANGLTFATNPIGYTYSNFSYTPQITYFFKGITPGITYTFSYYQDSSRGFSGQYSKQYISHYVTPAHTYPIGITFSQTLPQTISNSFVTAGISYGAGNTWTKLEFKFNLPIGNTYDYVYRDTVKSSVVFIDNEYSVMDSGYSFASKTMFVTTPTFQVDGSCAYFNTPALDYETITRWHYGPPVGWAGYAFKGPNRRYNLHLLERGAIGGYFGEVIRHCLLSGSKHFGIFNVTDYVNYGVTGSISDPGGGDAIGIGQKANLYNRSGLTQHVESYQYIDGILKEVKGILGGFTTGYANIDRIDWMAPYIATGAPGATANEWKWRVTALSGFTVYCNGETLGVYDQIGTWVTTSGPTLAGVPITWTKWPYQSPEISVPTPVKEFDFSGMTSLSELVALGFTFSRGSTASYVDSTGKVVFVGPNQPRFTYNPFFNINEGLFLEKSATNLLNWSETFAATGGSQNNWNDTRISRTSGFTSPSGLSNAIRFTATGSNATVISSTAQSTAMRTFSIWLRGVTGNESVSLTINGGTTWVSYPVTNKWERYYYGFLSAPFHVGVRIGNTGESIEMWGAQLESRTFGFYQRGQEKFASSYIPTTSTTASRSEDSCSLSGTSFSSWFGNTYGTFVIQTFGGGNGTPVYLSKDSSNYMGIFHGTNPSLISRINNQISDLSLNSASWNSWLGHMISPYVEEKTIFSYSPTGMRGGNFTQYGVINWAGNTIGPPQVNQMILGNNVRDCVNIKKIRYWNYVFDESVSRQMMRTGVDWSINMIGGNER